MSKSTRTSLSRETTQALRAMGHVARMAFYRAYSCGPFYGVGMDARPLPVVRMPFLRAGE